MALRSAHECQLRPVLPPRLCGWGRRTHILTANLGATFFHTVLYVLFLVALVVSQTSDEVVERFLEPFQQSDQPRTSKPIAGLAERRTSCRGQRAVTPPVGPRRRQGDADQIKKGAWGMTECGAFVPFSSCSADAALDYRFVALGSRKKTKAQEMRCLDCSLWSPKHKAHIIVVQVPHVPRATPGVRPLKGPSEC